MHQATEASQACGNTGRPEVQERERQPPAGPAAIAPISDDNAFHREGDYWSVAFEGQIVRLRDLKGLRYLARLLDQPGREFHVLDLAAGEGARSVDTIRNAERGLAFLPGLDAGVFLDAQAKEAHPASR